MAHARWDGLTNEQILAEAPKCETKVELAAVFGISESSFRSLLTRRGISKEVTGALKAHQVSVVERAKDVEPSDHEPTPEEESLARLLLSAEASRSKSTAKLSAAKREIRDLEEERDRLARALDAVTAAENQPRPEWLRGAEKPRGHHGTLIAAFSDFHIGEVVNPSEIGGYNAYNPEIAEFRTRRFFEKTIVLSRDYLAGVTYDGIVVPNLGDTISGEIHEELCETNGLSNFEAVPLAAAWLEEGIGMFADEFGKVHLPCVPGNHPRDRKQPRYKRRVAHNADTLISKLVAERFKNDDRVTFDIPDSLYASFEIYSTRFRIEHGDEVKGSGGGVQGILPALTRFAHKRRQQELVKDNPFDVLMIGHFHQLTPVPGMIVNGAGKGFDEYADGNGFRPEVAQQFLGIVTPERGLTGQYPVHVASRTKEGW